MIRTLAVVTLSLAAPAAVQANVGETYGFGSRNSALGGAGAAWGFDGYAAYFNPAGLALNDGKRIVLSWGLLAMKPSFLPIENVVVENSYTSDRPATSPRKDNVSTDYRTTLGQALGATFHLAPDLYNLSAGISVFLPLEAVAYMDTGEPFAPEYGLYRSRTQRPQIDVGVGFQPWGGIHFGLGVHVAYALTSNATVYLQSDPNKTSTMRFAATMKPKAAPFFGLLFTTDGEGPHAGPTSLDVEPDGQMSFGAVLRMPVTSENYMTLNSTAGILSPLPAIDFKFNSASALFYDPLAVEVGWSWQQLQWARIYLQIEYQQWSKYQPPALAIADGTSGSGVTISSGKPPSFEFRDILVPRAGEELSFGMFTLRAGYAYRPGILKTLPTGAGNFLDPPKHMVDAGIGIKFRTFLGLPAPNNLDLHGSLHSLRTQRIDKDQGDETGAGTGDLKIGAPGYDAGGKIYGGGVSLTFEL